jgi:hypothetical protein
VDSLEPLVSSVCMLASVRALSGRRSSCSGCSGAVSTSSGGVAIGEALVVGPCPRLVGV